MKDERYGKINLILMISSFVLLLIFFCSNNSIFLYISIIPFLFAIALLVMSLRKILFQNYKDNKFQAKFSNKLIYPVSGIYWKFNWNKFRSSSKELGNQNRNLPYFLLNFANKDSFNITLWEMSSKYHEDNPHKIPRIYLQDFFFKDFRYSIKSAFSFSSKLDQ